LPNEVEVSAYSEHDVMLSYSLTTMKKDKNKLLKQTRGYVQVMENEISDIEFDLKESGKYSVKWIKRK